MTLKLQTPVVAEACRTGISYGDRIVVLGSCFADQMGQKLLDYGFQATVNPFGTLYNPVSIANAVSRLSSAVPFTEADVVEVGAGDGRFCSFSHHTSFARSTPEAFLDEANAALSEASRAWADADKVIVTLGTAWAFRLDATGETVANCLKHPAREFSRYRLSAGQVTALLQGWAVRFPEKQFIFTVSPIRHLADGAHGNQLSKSTLLLGIEAALPSFGCRAEYFPAYEIVLDELRDYRFYAEDMVHPSAQTVGYLWDRFLMWGLPEAERERYEKAERAFRASCHRQNGK